MTVDGVTDENQLVNRALAEATLLHDGVSPVDQAVVVDENRAVTLRDIVDYNDVG